MALIHVDAETTVAAPPKKVYRLIADYTKDARMEWLPANYNDYAVEQGGTGDGTVYHYKLKVGNRERAYRMAVSEPKRGSILAEKDTASTLTNTWTVTAQGAESRVTLRTEWQGHGGVGGFFERLFAPRALKRVYDDELARLAAYAAR